MNLSNVVSVVPNYRRKNAASKLPFRVLIPDDTSTLEELISTNFKNTDGIVLFLNVGSSIRLISKLLSSKTKDPAVICVDEGSNFVVSLIGGHSKNVSANWLTKFVANLLDATPVVTTASDVSKRPAIELFRGFMAEGEIKKLSLQNKYLSDLTVSTQLDWIVPPQLSRTSDERADLIVSDIASDNSHTGKVILRPKSLVVGVGLSTQATFEELLELVVSTFEKFNLSLNSIGTIATIDKRANHENYLRLVNHFDAASVSITAETLNKIDVPNPSDDVLNHVGTVSVAEAAAIYASQSTLIATKHKTNNATVAIARNRKPKGTLNIVGIGPGSVSNMTFSAVDVINHASVIVGFNDYIDYIDTLLDSNQVVERFEIGKEIERVLRAIDYALSGHNVALVSSGDAGVFAMASLAFEELGKLNSIDAININVVPGITASLSAASLLGAPLGHDHVLLSLSDLHTDFELIKKRAKLASESDFVMALYNPSSKQRSRQFIEVLDIIKMHKPLSTLVGVVTDAYRKDQNVKITTLSEIDENDVTMKTLLIIGNKETKLIGQFMVTPRGYKI